MKSFGETLSGRVERVRGWLGIKAKKIVDDGSENIFTTLNSTAPQDGGMPSPQKDITTEPVHIEAHRDEQQPPSAMAA